MTRDLGPLVGAIDQGTSSTRFLVFASRTSELITYHQMEVKKIYPNEGWVEQDPLAILATVTETIRKVHDKLLDLQIDPAQIRCIGVSNQRESTVVWDSETGRPLYNSLVWLDNRTKDMVEKFMDTIPNRDFNYFKDRTGLPISTYFSAFKLKWLIENVSEVREALKNGRLKFGTIDSWLVYNLTGNHYTDVSNASRTFLMDIERCDWDQGLLKMFDIPAGILPTILSSSDMFGELLDGPLKGVPITGILGDQMAALVGQNCIKVGETKVTYGTGCFLVQNIGQGPVTEALRGIPMEARQSLLVSVAYRLRNKPAVYCLEGSVAIAGAAITWLRDNMELIKSYDEIDTLCRSVYHTAGVFFIPAFQGLYAPYWDPSATGLIIGLSGFSKKAHIVRATLEAICYQTCEILSIMRKDADYINIDGGVSCNDLLCQTLADLTGYEIVRPAMVEATGLGAARVAGDYLGLFSLSREAYGGSTDAAITGGRLAAGPLQNHHPTLMISHSVGENGSIATGSGEPTSTAGPGKLAASVSFDSDSVIATGTGGGRKKILARQGSILDYLNVNRIHRPFSSQKKPYPKGSDVFRPMISDQYRTDKINEWKLAIERCRRWTRVKKEELKRTDYRRLAALPIGLHVLLTLGMIILSNARAEVC